VDSSKNDAELKDSLRALSKIYKGILNIQKQQLRDRYRLALHSASNTHNYNDVFYGSVVETAIFIAVSLFQVS
jgi:hypothetical protein